MIADTETAGTSRSVLPAVIGGIAVEVSADPFMDFSPAGGHELDTKETSVSPPLPSTYRDWIKRVDPLEAAATEEALETTLKHRIGDRYVRYKHCRKQAYFFRHRETGEVRVIGQSCKIRWCYLCGRSKAQVLSRRLGAWTARAKHPKLLTLTLRSSPAPLIVQLNALYTFFRRLRQHPIVSKALLAGHWFVQLTYNSQTQHWHPHIHAICVGAFLDNKILSHIWRGITHTSYIVDCRTIKDTAKVATYVARYAARPCSLASLSLARRLEVMQAFHGRRLHNSWGRLARVGLPPQEKFNPALWSPVGSWQNIVTGLTHNPIAQHIWQAWREGIPLAAGDTLIPEIIECPRAAAPPPRVAGPAPPDLPGLTVYRQHTML